MCTGVMIHGYPMVKQLCGELQAFMSRHDFRSIADFRGASLPYFTTHQQLVRLQREALEHKKKVRPGWIMEGGEGQLVAWWVSGPEEGARQHQQLVRLQREALEHKKKVRPG